MVEDVVVKKFTFAISSPDEFLVNIEVSLLMHYYSARSYRLQPNIGFTLERASDGVHAFGYNSAESEQIWMKSGAL